ncbi:MAG TPA: DUF2752 domain-containing protein [Candidatus Binatia bacterium]|nr:DUF2752 domain-containing protein [Candidatus Binatia bacterium]
MRDPTFVARRLAVVGAALAVLVAPFVYAPYVDHGPTLCPWHGLLGLPCPGCGMTRAFCALARFDVWSALGWNALSIPLVVVLGAAVVAATLEIARGRAYGWYRRLGSRGAVRACGGAVMAYHVCRVVYWAAEGTLADTYLRTSWTYAWLHALTR